MADLKFSCGHCGQHISCEEPWAGHQIQCPACRNNVTVPSLRITLAPAAPEPRSPVSQPPAASRHKLSAGATQVTRSTPTAGVPQRRVQSRGPKTTNPALKYAAVAVIVVVLVGVALKYLPGLLGQVQEVGNSKASGSASAPAVGGGGPLGEANGAMDVSDALDSGSSRPRPVLARQPTAVRPAGTLTTNSTARSPNGSLGTRSVQPGQAGANH